MTSEALVGISKNEIRQRATTFSHKYRDATSERSDGQSFWHDFFAVFGVERRQVAVFEKLAKRSSTGGDGLIDLLYPGAMAVEHKSHREDLDKAMQQVLDYLPSLTKGEHPWLLIACDFQRFRWQNLDDDTKGEFPLTKLSENLDLFWWIAGHAKPGEQFPNMKAANLAATELLAAVYDRLASNFYEGHALREWMTRILFCLFADGAGVWDRAAFHAWVALHTREDGTDLGSKVAHLFQVLNTPHEKRPPNLDEDLDQFIFVNGDLFAETLPIPSSDREVRDALLEACAFDWGSISPAIFGSLFQNVMDPVERRNLGAHYTTEANILRTIRPLFLDDLEAELVAAATRPRLQGLLNKLADLTFFDPACGCGNFLVIAYREVRRLELEALRKLYTREKREGQMSADITLQFKVRVDQFYGIEIEEFPAKIARTALYLMDHLANREASVEFGQHFVRFPIPASPSIVIGNALRVDWNEVLPADQADYVFGNPPFVDRKNRGPEQREDHVRVHGTARRVGNLDYVAGWFVLAAQYMRGTTVKASFVATNSISQGSQVPLLWPQLLDSGVTVLFAHRTFAWTSEARGQAHVHVVIVGFECGKEATARTRRLFEYPDPKGEGIEIAASRIGPYLSDGPPIVVHSAGTPISKGIPAATYGSTAGDKGHLIFSSEDLEEALFDPVVGKYLKRYIGAEEHIKGRERWILWLENASPSDMRSSKLITERVEAVRAFRESSARSQTNLAAATPYMLLEARAPQRRYLFVPCVSSERREYIPMSYYDPDTIVRASSWFIEGADDYLFGILHSAMFMAWVRTVGGRLKSDYQVSADTVYNTFPFPEAPAPVRKAAVVDAAIAVQGARDLHDEPLEALYDPRFMPADLREAHTVLDRAVDKLFSARRKIGTEADRLSILLERYVEITTHGSLGGPPKPTRRSRKRSETAS